MAKRRYYKGDTHLHTINSDGVLTKGQLVERCKEQGLDFMIITDHNFNSVDESYYDGDMLVIQGQELTGELGHINVWGKKIPFEPPYDLSTKDKYIEILKKCKEDGAIISLNHPFCSNCGFKFDIDDVECDCVEVWNTIQHTDNMVNRDWWVKGLLSGKRIGAVGGSDYHRNYAGLNILAHPTTYVLADDNTEEAILKAMVEGRSFVTNSPNSTEIYLSCGDASLGDTVKLEKDTEVTVSIKNIKPMHTIKVYNNDKVIYEEVTKKIVRDMFFNCKVEEPGFVRVEVTYEFVGPIKTLYNYVEKKFLHSNKDFIPPFIRAFTNPIYFEK